MKNALALFGLGTLLLCSCSSGRDSTSCTPSTGNDLLDALNYAQTHAFVASGELERTYNASGASSAGGTSETLNPMSLSTGFADGVISSKKTYHYEVDGESFDDSYEATYYRGEDGLTYRKRLTLKNKVEEEKVLSSSSKDPLTFDEHFSNPFAKLEYIDFVKLGSGYLLKPGKRADFAVSFLQEPLSVGKVVLTLEGNRFKKLEVDSTGTTMISGLTTSDHYGLSFDWGASPKVPELKPYAHSSEHEALKKAVSAVLGSLSSRNYTAEFILEYGDDSQSIPILYESGKIYCDYKSPLTDSSGNVIGYQASGYLPLGEEYYPFTQSFSAKEEPTSCLLNDEEAGVSRDSLEPDWSSFAPEVFAYDKKEKAYFAHSEFAGELAYALFPSFYRAYLANYASGIKAKLDESGRLSYLSCTFSDYQNGIYGEASVSYDSFGSTAIPSGIAEDYTRASQSDDD